MKKKAIRLNGMTERLLASNGWVADQVESFNGYAGVSNDFLGFADYIAVHPVLRRTAAIQVTVTEKRNARARKILCCNAAHLWLLGGNEIWILHWKKEEQSIQSKNGLFYLRKVYIPCVNRIYSADFNKEFFDYWEAVSVDDRKNTREAINSHAIRTEWIDLNKEDESTPIRDLLSRGNSVIRNKKARRPKEPRALPVLKL